MRSTTVLFRSIASLRVHRAPCVTACIRRWRRLSATGRHWLNGLFRRKFQKQYEMQ